MVPLMQTSVMPAVVNQNTPMNNSFLDGGFDFLNQGLALYTKFDAVQRAKDAGGAGQEELSKTVQTPNPAAGTTAPNPAQDLRDKMAQGLQIGTGTLAAVVGGVVLLYFLSRK